MSTYVLSDIHGYLDRVFDLMDQVNFTDSDSLYVLGDIGDRGPQSGEAIKWAVEAPANIHFLIGNHEDMMLASLKQDPYIFTIYEDSYYDPYYNVWSWNGGIETMDQLSQISTGYWRKYVLIPWLEHLPFYYDVEVAGNRWMMIHAGLASQFRMSDDRVVEGINEWIEIPDYGEVYSQNLLWIRERWLYNIDFLPYNVIFGHTPTTYDWMQELKYPWTDEVKINVKGNAGDIVILSGYPDSTFVRVCVDTGRKRTGMIRLDDMEEFYSEVNCG